MADVAVVENVDSPGKRLRQAFLFFSLSLVFVVAFAAAVAFIAQP